MTDIVGPFYKKNKKPPALVSDIVGQGRAPHPLPRNPTVAAPSFGPGLPIGSGGWFLGANAGAASSGLQVSEDVQVSEDPAGA